MSEHERHTTGPLLIVGAAVLWGTTGTAQAVAPPAATSTAVGALRLLVGGATLLALLHLGLLTVAAAYLLFARGLQVVSVSTVTTLSLAEPLTAGVLGVLLLGEKLTPAATVGIALIAAGLVILTLRCASSPDARDQ